jgi:hypothetical protein
MTSNVFNLSLLAILALALPAIGAAQPGDNDTPHPTRASNRAIFRRFPSAPLPCGTSQNHTVQRRPCSSQQSGGNDTHQQGDGGELVLGGTTWPFNPSQQSGNDGPPNPNHDDSPKDNHAPTNTFGPSTPPGNFEPTPEPTYVVLTGIAFTGLALFARKTRRNHKQA